MGVWRRTSTEMAGAWRSLRYDMGRRPFEPPADGPDVTSTGMNTFGGGTSGDLGPEWCGPDPAEMPVAGRMPKPRRRERSPWRTMAVSGLGLLTVAGAAGAYLFAVNGLVPMRDAGPAAAGTVPPATTTAESGLGGSPRTTRTEPRPAKTATTVKTEAAPQPRTPSPMRTSKQIKTIKTTSPICCRKPPVPTPTAPASSPSPTPTASASPSASVSDPDSDNTSEFLGPRRSWHHRRPH